LGWGKLSLKYALVNGQTIEAFSSGDKMNEESIFAEACAKKTPVERAAYLDGVCGRNQELRNRIEELLAAQSHPDEFLEEPPPGVERDVEQTMAHSPSRVAKGTRIGRYKLLEEIGEGGMGTVWVAEQTEPVRRKVALKLVKAGMDSAQVVARFNAERQALAVMDHPNIAKVYDGGLTEQGRPYFVMEYVKGVPT
jgi:eukaryotic-like serine/threonine-protein kinase